MAPRLLRDGWRFAPELAGLAALLLLFAAWLPMANTVRDRALDVVLPWIWPSTTQSRPGLPAAEIVLVDIDRASLARLGPWPWPRARLAELVAAVTAARPLAVGIDILFADSDRLSPAALARGLAAATGREDFAALAHSLPDADRALAKSITDGAVVLGIALDTTQPVVVPEPPVGMRMPRVLPEPGMTLPDIWKARGIVEPPSAISLAASARGVMSIAADTDGLVRRVPLLAHAANSWRPGLAAEIVRLAQQAGNTQFLQGPLLRIGAIELPLAPDAMLRLVPRGPGRRAARSIPAAEILHSPGIAARLAGRIVLIGSSAPEVASLRAMPGDVAAPTLHIQADAVETLLHGPWLRRPQSAEPMEPRIAVIGGLVGILLAVSLRPLRATAAMLALLAAWAGIMAWAISAEFLPDPAGPPAVALGAFAATALVRAARDDWRTRRLRASFEQYLAPDVVRRIAADPTALRLAGEQREITALFTDIEGFTSLTERAEPADLVALLDAYFDMAGRVITAHGGMMDKIVGDAVTAIFNVPFDLPDHPTHALNCAIALQAGAEELRLAPLGRKLGLGPTRIGLETGPAIVGDIGGSRKLDYTAYGNVMNTAARLEAANKQFHARICIGPAAAARIDATRLRPLGTLTPRGQSRALDVFTVVGG